MMETFNYGTGSAITNNTARVDNEVWKLTECKRTANTDIRQSITSISTLRTHLN